MAQRNALDAAAVNCRECGRLSAGPRAPGGRRKTTMAEPSTVPSPRGWRQRFGAFWEQYHWAVLASLWLAAVGLGAWGVQQEFEALARAGAGHTLSFSEYLYRALQLFVLQDTGLGVSQPVESWQYQMARFLAPTVAGLTAVQAASFILREQWERWRLRRLDGHVVVCGLGRKGAPLAEEFLAGGERVVAIENDPANRSIHRLRELGGVVLTGDATHPSLLRRAGVGRAKTVIAICGEDGVNVEIAVRTHQVVRETPADGAGTVTCCVQLADLKLRNLLRQNRIYTETKDRLEVRFFNPFEAGARRALQEFPPDVYAPRGGPIRLLVVGFGQLGESLVVQAAKVGHYANGAKLHITVIDRVARSREAVFRLRYPQFDSVCEVRFLEMDTRDVLFLGGRFLRDAGAPLAAVFICLDNDRAGLATALTLLLRLEEGNAPILVRMHDASGLATLLEPGESGAAAQRIRAFGTTQTVARRAVILDDVQDHLARAIHDDYVAQQKAAGKTPQQNPSLVSWRDLPEDLKDSNRQQADHIPVKLRAAGCTLHPAGPGGPAPFAFTPQEVELLARMEHARWNAERFLAGWRFAPGPKNLEARTSPYLVEYDVLPEEIKEYDRQAVRNILRLVGLIGQEIRRG